MVAVKCATPFNLNDMNADFLKAITTEEMPQSTKPAEPVKQPEAVPVEETVTAEPAKPIETTIVDNEPEVLTDEEIPTGEPKQEIPPNQPRPEAQAGSEKRGRGRPPKNAVPHFDQMTDADKSFYLNQAEITFTLSTNTLQMIFNDPNWQPRLIPPNAPPGTKTEKEMVVEAIARYYKEIGIVDLPPGWTLAFVVAMYAMPRMVQSPNTSQKIKYMFDWLRNKIMGLFRRK